MLTIYDAVDAVPQIYGTRDVDFIVFDLRDETQDYVESQSYWEFKRQIDAAPLLWLESSTRPYSESYDLAVQIEDKSSRDGGWSWLLSLIPLLVMYILLRLVTGALMT